METQKNGMFGDSVSDSTVVAEGKIIAVIAYLTFIGLIVSFIMNNEKKNSFASFHIRQSLGIGLTGILLWMINFMIPVLGWIVGFVGFVILFVMWIVSLISALNGTEKPVFLLGEKYQAWFKGI